MTDLSFAVWMALGLVPAFLAHEYAQAWTARRLGDAGPALNGRLSLDVRRHADPLGTFILPGLILLLVAAGRFVPPFAYGTPIPFRSRDRRTLVLSVLAGPAANLVLAVVAALAIRVAPGVVAIEMFLVVNVSLFAFHLVPLPPFDASLVLARYLPPQAAEFMDKAQPLGAIVILVVFFIFPGPVFTIVETLGNGLCQVLVGGPCL